MDIEFVCPYCGKKTEDTTGGVLVDGFILECSECNMTTVVSFETDDDLPESPFKNPDVLSGRG